MRRRALLIGIAVLSAGTVNAQDTQPARIGWLTSFPVPTIEAFRQGMRDAGYREGSSFVIEERNMNGAVERMPAAAGELVRSGVDVIVAVGSQVARPLRESGVAVPVVFIAGDPVGLGLAASLSRPGGNFTGVSIANQDFAVKWLELIAEIVPAARLIAVLTDGTRGVGNQLSRVEEAAHAKDIMVLPLVAAGPQDIEPAFDRAGREGVEGIIVASSARFHAQHQRIVQAAARAHIPTVYEHRDFTENGGLLSYGRDIRAAYRLTAYYVDRILKGDSPGDLPIEEPSRLELVVNMRTARSLGLELPPLLLVRADEVIE